MVTENEQTSKPDNDSESVSSYVPRGEPLKNELMSISALTDRLESAIRSLPHVNICRQGDLSYVRRLYEEKERLEQELTSKVEVLKQYHKVLSKEVDRCMKNLQTIQEDATKLNLQETSEYYSQAEEAQQKQYDSAVADRNAVSVVLKKAQAVLSLSKTRKFPSTNFGGQFPSPAGIPGSLTSTSQSPAGGFNSEIAGLISMGPFRQKLKGILMNTLNMQSKILLGVGGDDPGVDVYNPISGSLEKILPLDPGHSVYTICSNGETIAAGTKTGEGHCIGPQGPELEDNGHLVQQFTNGASILSMSFVDPSTLAVADTSGRCLLYQLRGNGEPKELFCDKRIIYALFCLDSRHLAGLAVSGEIIVWDWMKKRIVSVMDVPVPSDKLTALITPVYWPAEEVWVWPGRGGTVVFYDWRRRQVRTVCCHSEDVYAVVVCQEHLLTIGKTDGCAKCWDTIAGDPVDTFEAPHGIISAASWQQDKRTMLLLINDEGKAEVYSLTDQGFGLVESLAGQNYRIAVGPDAEGFKLAVQRQKARRTKELVTYINEQIMQQQYHELGDCYNELDELGFSQVALYLRGREAGAKNDFVGKLKVYNQLAGIIPHEHPGSETSLVQYAGLLESACQLKKAYLLYKELTGRYPENDAYTESLRRLLEYSGIVESGEGVIEADIPILSLVESAMVLDERFKGRYLFETRAPVSCRELFSADEFVKKYEQICQSKSQMPVAEKNQFHWLSKKGAEPVTAVIFKSEESGPFSHIELGIKFFNAALQSVLVPVIVLNAGRKVKGISKQQHNQAIIEELSHIEDDRIKGWLEMVGHTINHTVRQLITRKKADSNRQSGAIQC